MTSQRRRPLQNRLQRRATVYLVAGLLLSSLALMTQAAQRVVDASELARFHPANAFEALDHLGSVSQATTVLGTDSLLISGLATAYQQLMINGQSIQTADDEVALLLQTIPFGLLERIEIMTTPDSQLDWGGGSSASINLVLRNRPDRLLAARASQRGGWGLTAADGERDHWGIAANWQQQSQQYSGSLDDGIRQQPDWDRRISQHEGSAYAHWQSARQNQWQFTGHGLLFHKHQQLNQTELAASLSQAPLQPGLADEGFQSTQRWLQWQITATPPEPDSILLSSPLRHTVSVDGQHTLTDIHADYVKADQSQQRLRLSWSVHNVRGEHQWVAGIGYLHRQFRSSETSQSLASASPDTRAPQWLRFNEHRLFAHVSDHWQLSGVTQLHVGLRAESYELSQQRRSDSDASDIATVTHWLPHTRINYQLSNHSDLELAMGQSVRAATAAERVPRQLLSEDFIWQGNGELNDEVITQTRFSYQQQFSPLYSARQQGLIWELFQHQIRDRLYYDYQSESGQTRITPRNSDDIFVLRGTTLQWRNRLPVYRQSLDIRLNGGLFKADGTIRQQRQRLSKTPDYSLGVALASSLTASSRITAQWQYLGKTTHHLTGRNALLRMDSPASSSTTLTLDYQANHWQWWARLTHRPDRRYEEGTQGARLSTDARWNWSVGFNWQPDRNQRRVAGPFRQR